MKDLITRVIVISLLVTIGILLSIPHENKPPKIQDEMWPSCHWDGANDNWEVSFQIDDLRTRNVVWKQWVATGISEKAAENLCDSYFQVIDLNKEQ